MSVSDAIPKACQDPDVLFEGADGAVILRRDAPEGVYLHLGLPEPSSDARFVEMSDLLAAVVAGREAVVVRIEHDGENEWWTTLVFTPDAC